MTFQASSFPSKRFVKLLHVDIAIKLGRLTNNQIVHLILHLRTRTTITNGTLPNNRQNFWWQILSCTSPLSSVWLKQLNKEEQAEKHTWSANPDSVAKGDFIAAHIVELFCYMCHFWRRHCSFNRTSHNTWYIPNWRSATIYPKTVKRNNIILFNEKRTHDKQKINSHAIGKRKQ